MEKRLVDGELSNRFEWIAAHRRLQLIAHGCHSVVIALTGPGEFTDSALRLLGKSPARATVRVLCTAEAAEVAANRLHRLPEPRLQVSHR